MRNSSCKHTKNQPALIPVSLSIKTNSFIDTIINDAELIVSSITISYKTYTV